jgi:L-lactate dehydrogenase complex protein LldG
VNSARDNVLGRVRKALGKREGEATAFAAAEAQMMAHGQGPRPVLAGDRVLRFILRARAMESSIERIAERAAIPAAVARYLDGLRLPPAPAGERARAGVCWPELASLDWAGAGLEIEARPTQGNDRLGITGVFCAIAETGTMVLLAAADAPTASALLPDTHVAVVPASRIVDGMEDAFALIRRECGQLPRAVNMISGPSRTGDIEQTIVLGAHGPFRVHILIVDR